jgi:hypothetical protein
MEETTRSKKRKPGYDRLSESVQVLLKPHEFNGLDSIRRESPYSSNAAYVRSLILADLKKKNQTELFPKKNS